MTPRFGEEPDTQALTILVTSNLTRAFGPDAVTHTPWCDMSKSPPGVSHPSAQAAAPLGRHREGVEHEHSHRVGRSDRSAELHDGKLDGRVGKLLGQLEPQQRVLLCGALGVLNDGRICCGEVAYITLILSVSHIASLHKYETFQ
mgnify:CR=1 FL=1